MCMLHSMHVEEVRQHVRFSPLLLVDFGCPVQVDRFDAKAHVCHNISPVFVVIGLAEKKNGKQIISSCQSN